MSRIAGGLRNRRGATMVLVALLSVVLVGMAAFAIDISRMYVGTNELQTGADAAALRGALQLQRAPGASPADSVIAFAGSNNALNAPIAVNAADIEPIYWDPAKPDSLRAQAVSDFSLANAVRVTTRASAGLLFGRVWTSVVPVPSRRAIAWIANVTGVDCYQPTGISLSVLAARLGQPLTTQEGVNALTNLLETPGGPALLTVAMSPQINAPIGTATPADGFYEEMTGETNPNPNNWENMIRGSKCGNGTVESPVGTEHQQPGQGNEIAMRADAFFADGGPCKAGAKGDATCYDPKGSGFSAGPEIVVPLTLPAATPNTAKIVMLTRFRLMCAFSDAKPPLGASKEHCPWLESIGRTPSDYRNATIVGYPLGGFYQLGPGTELGNTISTAQRLILVR